MDYHLKTIFLMALLSFCCVDSQAQYTMPMETSVHEGTWLQWPHNELYGPYYRGDLRATFVAMTKALVSGENVHIIAFDEGEKNYIQQSLISENVPLDNVSFHLQPNDDCWVRDNGPIFVFDEDNELVILDWGFNGWGNDTPYEHCDIIPEVIGTLLNMPVVDLNNVVLEGGAFEIDGNGSFLATKSSILETDRNPNLSQAEVEQYLSDHLGVSNFIWLEGESGLEITDMHIDGFARFHDTETIVCMDSLDLIYWEVPPSDISTLYAATDVDEVPYNYVYLPLTQNDVRTTWGQNLGYKGSYVNYYIGNEVVLVPTYNDPKDDEAIAILQNLYPEREAIGIDVRNLYLSGGMIHCVTQQQPEARNTVSTLDLQEQPITLCQNTPNPFYAATDICFSLIQKGVTQLSVYDIKGQLVATMVDKTLPTGEYNYSLQATGLSPGIYTYTLTFNNQLIASKKMILAK
jgi:agmatine deiminase